MLFKVNVDQYFNIVFILCVRVCIFVIFVVLLYIYSYIDLYQVNELYVPSTPENCVSSAVPHKILLHRTVLI